VLSIAKIDSTSEVVSYYAHLGEKENFEYYSEDGNRPGGWWGEGAEALGLTGDVTPEVFENLLNGLSPDGTKSLVQQQSGSEKKRLAGIDLTFSEVKSFSAAWALADERRRAELDAVAEKSLYRVMDVVQELCGVTRRGKGGATTENAKLIGAVFHHDTARPIPGEAPDPNKHHHLVIVNATMREDGTSGALDARPLFQPRMKMALGALWRAELTKLLAEDLGIATYRPSKEHKEELVSWYELAEVPAELTHAMSKRRQAIEKYLRDNGLSGAKASEQAALRTREVKKQFTWSELTAAWQKMGSEHSFTKEDVEQLFGKAQQVEPDKPSVSMKVVKDAIAALIEHKARFSENELLERVAVDSQTRGIGIDDILGAVQKTIEQGVELVRLKDTRGVRAFTTQAMLDLEKTMLSTAKRLDRRSNHIVAEREVNKVIAKYPTLRPDQAKAVRAICSGSDITSVIGVAGAGKTFALKLCREVLEGSGYRVLGTALASRAAKGLQNDSGITSCHIHKLLFEIEKGNIRLTKDTVLVVDEAGVVGTVHMEKLTRLAEKSGAKIALVGDPKQLQSITAGATLRAIADEVMATEIHTNVRQRKQWSKNVVQHLREGEADRALVELHKRGGLVISDDRQDSLTRLVRDWSELVFDKGQAVNDTLVFAGMNADVRELNNRIQAELKKHGQLGEYAVEAAGYRFHLGDQVMVTKNHRLLNLRNGTAGEVTGVEGSRMWVLTEDGVEVELNTDTFSDIALKYAMSIHKAQGLSCENALVITGDAMSDREWSYTAATRPKEKLVMYSDELSVGGIEELAKRVSISRQKEMANEHVLEIE